MKSVHLAYLLSVIITARLLASQCVSFALRKNLKIVTLRDKDKITIISYFNYKYQQFTEILCQVIQGPG